MDAYEWAHYKTLVRKKFIAMWDTHNAVFVDVPLFAPLTSWDSSKSHLLLEATSNCMTVLRSNLVLPFARLASIVLREHVKALTLALTSLSSANSGALRPSPTGGTWRSQLWSKTRSISFSGLVTDLDMAPGPDDEIWNLKQAIWGSSAGKWEAWVRWGYVQAQLLWAQNWSQNPYELALLNYMTK